jgi:hypothetical protein
MASSPDPNQVDDFTLELERMLQSRQAQRLNDLDKQISPQARLWMALAPGWTLELAANCAFPQFSAEGEGLFERRLSLGFAAAYPLEKEDGAVIQYFEMLSGPRAETLQRALNGEIEISSAQRRPAGLLKQAMSKSAHAVYAAPPAQQLVDLTAEIGERMRKAAYSQPSMLPPLLDDWSQLAALANSPDSLGQFFNQKVQAAFEQRQAGPIYAWLEKARSLAALLEYVFRPELSTAIDQAGRRIELLKRQTNDFRQLSSFLRREEQVRAVLDLMNGPDSAWGLHFVGAGGVGKTMIIRYITCLLGAAKNSPCMQDEPPFSEPIAVARIDFDYLNPDYPRLRPGLLLWSLAQELRPYDRSGGRANSLFDEVNRLLDQLHAQVAAAGLAPGERASRHPLFVQALRLYIDALKILGPRVLLILDTCEELAKASPEDEPNRNVSETLEILRALHDGAWVLEDAAQSSHAPGLTNLRVIFCGRRLLASSGPGWKSLSAARLQPCEFLRMHEIRGFPFPEAEGFLRRSQVPENLIPAVIQASTPDPRGSIQLEWDNPADRPADIPRCSPFKMRLYMEWAREVPPPEPDQLTGAAEDHYVELRILQRLNDKFLIRLLPLVSLLCHFDREALSDSVDLAPEDFEPAFEALQAQDWISSRAVSGGPDAPVRRVLDVDLSIRDSLRAYFETRGRILPADRRRAAAFLQARVLEAPLESLDWTDYDAALRAGEADLEQAVEWWRQVETRLFTAYLVDLRTPEILQTLLDTLTGRDAACGMRDPQTAGEAPAENRLRPYLLAALAVVQMYSTEPSRRRDTWRRVEETVSRRALPTTDRLLRLALAGQVAAAFSPGLDLEASLVERYLAAFERAAPDDIQETAAHAAALEALIERAERQESPPLPPNALSPRLERLSAGLSSPPWLSSRLSRWISSLRARAILLESTDLTPALAFLTTSLEPPDDPVDAGAARYWKLPDDFSSRVRLEFIRAAYPRLLSSAEVLATVPVSPAPPANPDQEKLLSATLRLLLCERSIGAEELPLWLKSENHPALCVCNAHRETPPLIVSLAEALFSAGRLDDAMQKLQDLSYSDYDTRRWINRARVEIAVRLRQWSYARTAARELQESARPEDQTLLAYAAAVEGQERPAPAADALPARLHQLWRLASPPTKPDRLPAWSANWNHRLSAAIENAPDFLTREALQIDLLELEAVARGAKINLETVSAPHWTAGLWSERFAAAAAAPVETYRLALRLRELAVPVPPQTQRRGIISGYGTPESFDDTQLTTLGGNLYRRLGVRRAAEIAVEEADLLSLRLPQITSIWDAPANHFRNAHDAAGELRAALSLLVQAAAVRTPAEVRQIDQLPAYHSAETLYAALPGAPALDELDGFYAGPPPTKSLLEFLKPNSWVPWLAVWSALRLLARGADLEPLRQEVEPAFGSSAGGRIVLPREWQALMRFAETTDKKKQSQSNPDSNGQKENTNNDRSFWILALIGLAVILGILIGGFFLFRSLAGTLMQAGSITSTGGQIFFYFLTMVLIYLIIRAIGALRARLNAIGFYELEIRPPGGQAGSKAAAKSGAQARLRLSRWALRLFPLPPRLVYRALKESGLALGSAASGNAIARDMKDKVVTDALKKAAGPQRAGIPLTLRLNLSPDTAAPPWETALAELVGRPDKPSRLKLRFVRQVENVRRGARKDERRSGPLPVFGLVTNAASQQVLAAAWSAQVKNKTAALSIINDVVNPQPQVRVLHIVARVELQFGGPAINLGSLDSTAQNIGQTVVNKSTVWLTSEQLRRAFPNLSLCILQGDPAGYMEQFAESSILAIELANRFAAELAREGIDAIVLPALPFALAPDVAARLVRGVPAYAGRGTSALTGSLAGARDRIYARVTPQTAGWNLAMSVSLYACDLSQPPYGSEMTQKMDPFDASMLAQAQTKKSAKSS